MRHHGSNLFLLTGLLFCITALAADPESFAITEADWASGLARPEYKGIDPCATVKGICIEKDFQPSVSTLVEFDFDSAVIRPEYNAPLDNLGRALNGPLSDAVLKIIGHTDSIGSEAYNQKLSERRARAVAGYLQRRWGISPVRLRTEGHGELEPIASNDTMEGRQRNRRVQFVRIGTYRE